MRTVALVLAPLLLAGCASSPVVVQATGPALGTPPTGRLASCSIGLGTVVDLRPSSAAGSVHGRAIDAEALTDRLRSQLVRAGLRPHATETGERLDVEIVHSYGQGKSTSMSFTTVLRGRYGNEELVARGVDTGLNWSGSAAEISRGLLSSFDTAAGELIGSVARRCTGVGMRHEAA